MVSVRIGEELVELSWDEWERRVEEGRIPPDALVRFEPVTGSAFVPARRLESFRSLRNDAAIAWRGSLMSGPPPILTALLVGVQIRIWWFARLPEVADWLVLNFTNWTAPTLEDGEVWRLLTMGFLHTDRGHLVANMLWLAYTGWNLEVALGRRNLLTLYLASVLGGSVLSMYGSAATPSLGASGGVFGLIAASMVFGFLRPDLLPERGRRYFGWAMLPYLLLMFSSGLTNDGIDNWSHLGGLLTGAMLVPFLDPQPLQRREGWNLRVQLLTGSVIAVVLGTLLLLGPRAYLLVDHTVAERASLPPALRTAAPATEDEPYESLEYAVPAGWSTVHVAGMQSGTGSPSPAGDRYWSVDERQHDNPRDPETVRIEWTEQLMRSYPHAAIGKLSEDTVAGHPGWKAEVSLDADGLEQLEWRFTTRGVWELHELWLVDSASARRLSPLRDSLRASVRWNEPMSLLEARTSVERIPTSLRARSELAQALAEVGHAHDAIALWQELIAEAPRDPELWRGYLRALTWYPQAVDNPDAIWSAALANAPDPHVIKAVVHALDGAGRTVEADGLLELAWFAAPKDRTLLRARRARGLWYSDVLDDPLLPYQVAFDPLTGEPRTAQEIERLTSMPLTLPNAALAGQAHHDLTASLAQQVVQGPDAPRAWAPLALLAWGKPSDEAPAKTSLPDYLRTVRKGDRVHGLPAAFNERLPPEVIDALLAQVSEAP